MDAAARDRLSALAQAGEAIAYFGYGSLVNPYTHRTEITGYARASVHGWQRRWQGRPDDHPDPISLLSSSPDGAPDTWLHGLLVFDHVANLPALDQREAGYTRHRLNLDGVRCEHPVPVNCPVYIYEGNRPFRPHQRHAILQSYLDAVLQGYHLNYGEAGVRRFIEETAGRETPILTDRDAPRYPRAVSLAPGERELFDGLLTDCTFVQQLP